MSKLFLTILNMSIPASFVILAVLAVRLLLKRAPRAFSCALWAVVLFRLLCPFSLNSVLSLLPVKPQAIPSNIGTMAIPRVDSGITVIDQAVNSALPAATPYMSINPMQVVIAVSALVWILGAAALLLYAVISAVRLHIRLSGSQQLEGNVYLAHNLNTPFVLGIIRPRIYLPESLSERETSYILSHERMHIRRKDPLVKSIAFLALSLHWFNPLVWVSFVLLAKDMEMACDEAVLREMGPGIKKEYSTSLLSLATKHLIFNGTPLAFGEGEVKGRVKNILNYKRPAFWAVIASVAAVAVVCAGLALNPKEDAAPQPSDNSAYPEWLASVWEWRTPYVGNASSVGNITDSWYTFYDASKNGFELYTDEAPYGAKIRYTLNEASGLTADEVFQNYSAAIEQNIVVLFSLVENLDYVEIAMGDESVYTFQREIYEAQYGDLWSQSETLEGLEMLYGKIGSSQINPSGQPQDIRSSGLPEDALPSGQPQDPPDPGQTHAVLPSDQPQDIQPLEENPDYQYLLKLFPQYYEPVYPDTPVEADLDGDGVMEQISAEDLRFNGGDGGCSISVSRLVNGKYTEIPLPDTYTAEQGFPVQMQWDGEELRIIFTDSTYHLVSNEVLASVYEAGYTPDAMGEIMGKPMKTAADAVSDFTIIEKEDGTKALVLKQYITGPRGSHADRIGYAITELTLHEDNTWDMTQYFLPAN